MKTAVFLLTALTFATAAAAPVKDSALSGKITDWPAGETGEVQLRPLSFTTSQPEAVLARASIDAQGNFTLKLPAAVALAKVLPARDGIYSYDGVCQGSLTLEPAAQVNFFDLLAVQRGKVITNLKYRTSRLPWPSLADNFRFQTLAFASAATSVDGAASCDLQSNDYYNQNGQRMRVETTAQLSAGWNTLNGTDSGSKMVFSGDPMPKNAFWHIKTGYGGIGLKPAATEDGKNVQVVSLSDGMPAQAAGLQVGDLILAVDGTPVNPTNVPAMSERVRGEENTTVTLTIRRGNQTLTIPIRRQFIEMR